MYPSNLGPEIKQRIDTDVGLTFILNLILIISNFLKISVSFQHDGRPLLSKQTVELRVKLDIYLAFIRAGGDFCLKYHCLSNSCTCSCTCK